MRIRDLLEIARPLFFENEMEAAPYSVGGTVTLLRANGQLYAVTPKHCLTNGQFEPEQALFPYHTGCRVFMPFDVHSRVKTSLEDDDLHVDIDIFRIWNERYDPEYGIGCLADTGYTMGLLDMPNTTLLVTGFPVELRHIDYNLESISYGRFTIEASIVKQNRFAGIDQISFTPCEDLDSFNGLSGSAVISVNQHPTHGCLAEFEGILLHASRESLLGLYLKKSWIHSYLSKERIEAGG